MLKNIRIGVFLYKRISLFIFPESAHCTWKDSLTGYLVKQRSKYKIILLRVNLITMLFIFIPFQYIFSQESESSKALKYFEKAKTDFQLSKWEDCENELAKAIKADSTLADAHILLGDVMLETGKPSEAVKQYSMALNYHPDREEVVYNLLANTLFTLERYSEACENYEKLLAFPDLRPDLRSTIENKLSISRFRKDLVEKPVTFNPVNLGKGVNTAADEYINTLSADGSGLFFTRRTENAGNYLKEFNEDFYYAAIHGDSSETAVKLDYPPGKENDAGALCISPDGRLLFFTACFRRDSYGSCDLFYSEKKGDTWSEVKNMGAHINSDLWDAQPSISPDGKTLYFASNRNGSIGSSDIWKTERMPDGGWSKPENLGTPVNTAEAEMAPFIHFDNTTLYFSSYGHPGLGGADLYRTENKNGKWSQPENLGYPINSSADELILVVDPEGKQGFISNNRLEGEGGYDIFKFDLYDAIRPIPVSYLKGKVFDKVNGNPLEARFELIDIVQDSVIIEALSDKQNGEFLVCLPGERNYALNVSCEGYLFYSENFPLSEIKSRWDPEVKNIPLELIAVGNTMVLRNIFYETDQYQLKAISFAELDKLVSFLVNNPQLRIEIGGHTDSEGTEEYNIDLSMKRAEAVYEYLLDHGITAGRLSYKGYGESRPVSSNVSEEGRALNRRTEIRIIGTG
jgi:outer membrane protein OmpA-like peptidoglycan-associated protein/tetratricopeptide (TPR) repeat protein